MKLRSVAGLLFFASALGCAEQELPVDDQADAAPAEEIEGAAVASPAGLMDQFVTAWNADDQAALAEIIAEDAILLGGGESIQEGEAIVTEWAAGQMASTQNLAVEALAQSAGGDYAFSSGRWSLEVTPEGEPNFTNTGSHTFIWEHQSDLNWRLKVLHIENDPAQE